MGHLLLLHFLLLSRFRPPSICLHYLPLLRGCFIHRSEGAAGLALALLRGLPFTVVRAVRLGPAHLYVWKDMVVMEPRKDKRGVIVTRGTSPSSVQHFPTLVKAKRRETFSVMDKQRRVNNVYFAIAMHPLRTARGERCGKSQLKVSFLILRLKGTDKV